MLSDIMSVFMLTIPHAFGKIKINPMENDYGDISLLWLFPKTSMTYNDKTGNKNDSTSCIC